tara:strand:+ start:297 stop:671 length:375 start_codon:yes stop_codon:yes gene_type:complete
MVGSGWLINKDTLYHLRFKTKRARNWKWYGQVYTLQGVVEKVGYEIINRGVVYKLIFSDVPGVQVNDEGTGIKWYITPVIPIDYDMEEDSDTWEIEFDVETERQKLHDACDTVLRTFLENEVEE